jgi:cytochrome c-type biogenesis protein CcmF
MVARVLGVLGFVSVGFLLFVLLTSNPFERLLPPAMDGRDLNPLLQDPGMVIHPPLLYMGYVGFAVAFAFAVAALLSGRFDAAWARWSRPWTTAAWVFLTIGIALGSWWAYYELGWGGWWFWDPVENASFMPWLAGTALIHSLAVAEKRGAFKAWTVLLAITAFSLSLLGTFLVRSGVLTSVHAFATDPARGSFILLFLGVVVGGSLALFGWRASQVGLCRALRPRVARVAAAGQQRAAGGACGAVMLGTLYPLAAGRAGPGQDLGRRALLRSRVRAADGAGGAADGHRPAGALEAGLGGRPGAARLKWPRWPAWWPRGAAALPPALQRAWWPGPAAGGLGLHQHAVLVLQRARGGAGQLARQSRSFWGMVVAHLGVGVFIVGVTMVRGYETERDVKMAVGDSVVVGGYRFTFKGADEEVQGPNYVAARGRVEVQREGGGSTLPCTPRSACTRCRACR